MNFDSGGESAAQPLSPDGGPVLLSHHCGERIPIHQLPIDILPENAQAGNRRCGENDAQNTHKARSGDNAQDYGDGMQIQAAPHNAWNKDISLDILEQRPDDDDGDGKGQALKRWKGG